MMLTRRGLITGGMALAALPAQARGRYAIDPVAVADGIWMIHGADAPIDPANGGAIANIAIIATPAGTVLCDCGPSLSYGQALRKVAEELTGQRVVRVYVTHLHPDHGMGIAAFDPGIVAALPGTIEALASEGRGYSDAMYRLLNDWMRGTELVLPGLPITTGRDDFGGRGLRLLALSGHSGADLALLDERSGLLIGGDLVFHDRAPSTPTADLPRWRASLDRLASEPHGGLVPGHGPFDPRQGRHCPDPRLDRLAGGRADAGGAIGPRHGGGGRTANPPTLRDHGGGTIRTATQRLPPLSGAGGAAAARIDQPA